MRKKSLERLESCQKNHLSWSDRVSVDESGCLFAKNSFNCYFRLSLHLDTL